LLQEEASLKLSSAPPRAFHIAKQTETFSEHKRRPPLADLLQQCPSCKIFHHILEAFDKAVFGDM